MKRALILALLAASPVLADDKAPDRITDRELDIIQAAMPAFHKWSHDAPMKDYAIYPSEDGGNAYVTFCLRETTWNMPGNDGTTISIPRCMGVGITLDKASLKVLEVLGRRD